MKSTVKTTYYLAMVERVRQCATDGLTVAQAAERLNCSSWNILKYGNSAGISFRKPPSLEESDWPLIKALLDDGMGVTIIMKKFNVGYYTLKRFIAEHNNNEPDPI